MSNRRTKKGGNSLDSTKGLVIGIVAISFLAIVVFVSGGNYFSQKSMGNDLQKRLGDLEQKIETSQAKIELGIDDLREGKSMAIEDIIESWELYKEDENVKVGAGNCGNLEFEDFLKRTNSGDRRILEINGLKLVFTPNYDNWSNEKFIEFNIDETAICEADGIYPLHAYPHKFLWRSICGAGPAPAKDEPGYIEFKHCKETLELVENYFADK